MSDSEADVKIRTLTEHVERLKREISEYIDAENVLVAAGLVSEDKVRQAHEIVRRIKD